jgi:hypothetical protein
VAKGYNESKPGGRPLSHVLAVYGIFTVPGRSAKPIPARGKILVMGPARPSYLCHLWPVACRLWRCQCGSQEDSQYGHWNSDLDQTTAV